MNNGNYKKGHIPWNKGIQMSNKTRDNMSKSRLEWYKTHTAYKTKPIGSIRLDKDGYELIKVELKDIYRVRKSSITGNTGWMLKSHKMWSDYHQKQVPPRHKVIFLNQDTRDYSKDNLFLIESKILVRVNKNNKLNKDVDYNKCSIKVEQLKDKIRSFKNKGGNNG